MAITRISQGGPNLSNTQLDTGKVAAAGRAAASVGRASDQAALQTVKQIETVFNNIGAQLNKDKTAQRNALLQDSLYRAKFNASERIFERQNARLDENGNPTFSTLPQDTYNIANQSMREIGETITDPEVKAEFYRKGEIYSQQQRLQSLGVQRQQDLDYRQTSAIKQLDALEKLAINDPSMTDEQIAREYDTVQQQLIDAGADLSSLESNRRSTFRRIHSGRIENVMSADPDAADKLIDSSNLFNDNEKRQMHERANKQRMANSAEFRKDMEKDLKDYRKLAEVGSRIDPQFKAEILQKAKGTQYELEYKKIEVVEKVMSDFIKYDTATRENIIRELESQDVDPESQDIINMLTSAHKSIETELKNDPGSLVIKQGLVPNRPVVNPSDGNFIGSLKAAHRASNILADNYSVVSSGLMLSDIRSINNFLRTSSFEEQNRVFGTIIAAYGEDSITVFKELSKDGGKQKALAGVMFLQGRDDIGKAILQGQENIKNGFKFPNDFDSSLRADMFPTGVGQEIRSDKIGMIKNIYAALAVDYGLDPKDLDTGLLDKAVQMANMGGLIEYNGAMIERPSTDIDTEDKFQSLLNNISIDEIEKLGGLHGMDPSQFLNDLKNERYTLFSVGIGAYVLRSTTPLSRITTENINQVQTVTNKKGKPFILDFGILQDLRNNR